MTERPEVDAFAEQLRADMESSLRPVVDQVLADAVRPWRRAVFWMGVGYAALITASVVQYMVR